ncbi:MAG: CRISPR-associated RAMP Cmr1 [Burkholderiaceae bacterium]|nr:MAG: CRISPR-associated RAMP Cmr1 [Burkholderiaceae bacterium]
MDTYRHRFIFTTPAFLGNASQQAQWRTPPVKALLRQWWRVTVAQELGYNVERLRQQESQLFGTAADDGGESLQSRVRIRLGQWNEGKLKDWVSTGTVIHPEVRQPVGSDLYLGFGPLEYNRDSRSSAIKNKAAIQAGDTNSLSIALPKEHAPHITTALWLMDRYGALGGRSRNGWGSFSLEPADEGTAPLQGVLPVRPWKEALQLDWPHAIGGDAQGALIWQTTAFDDWKKLMQELARLKIALRTQFRFNTGRDATAPEARHWLSYPVTNHSVREWGNNARLPNSLRFKARPAPHDPKKLVGVVFHVPCLPPPVFQPHRPSIERVWQTVHAFLDQPAQKLTRISA